MKTINYKKLIKIFLSAAVLLIHYCSFAWGPEGHAIVGRIAMQFLKEDVRQNVLRILGSTSVDTAANWMDIMRSNADYDFMKPWHFIEFAKDKAYQPSHKENIINSLFNAYNELGHKNILCDEQIKFDLMVLMHLVGDLHMPLHVSYEDDLGGNRRMIQFDTMKTHNLHKFWDEDIIRLKHITAEDCLALQQQNMGTVKIDFIEWMNESMNILSQVYAFPEFTLSEQYLNKNAVVVERQLLFAGLRLAAILNKLFYSAAPLKDMNKEALKSKNGIEINDAMKHLGKNVTVCSRVYGIRATDKITQINVGDKFPNNPLTIIIFAKNYINFKTSPDELYRNKNICVKGKVEEYKGKAQIIIEKPEDMIVQ